MVATVVIVLIWLVCSGILLFFIGEISPKERNFTKPRWVRVLMVGFGPITIAVGFVAFVIGLIAEQISIPDIIDNTRDAWQQLWTN